MRRICTALLFIAFAAASACSKPESAPAATLATPPPPTPEQRLRAELETWKGVPYAEAGTSRKGIGNAAFVRAVFEGAFGVTLPSTYDEQFRTGKLVAREKLTPGDLVFFEGQGIGPFRAKSVGIVIAGDEVAIAHKDLGVATVHLTEGRWNSAFKTARHVPTEPAAPPPAFDAATYGTNRGALLRDIAQAWAGTLYLQGGTTFDGIGNDEFVREVYGAVYEVDLDGTPKTWATMGEPVARTKLEPGDIILYEAVGLGKFINQRHAGIYIGDGEFVHAVKGSAVTISRLDDPRWSGAFKQARRLDPDALARAEAAHDAATVSAAAPPPTSASTAAPAAAAASPAASATPHVVTEPERKLRDATERWRGTPYKIGGTTKSGVDCSAFVRAMYAEVYTIELPRTAEEQEQLGTPVLRTDLEPGDLVFFRTQGMGPLFRSRHVGLYVGNGEFAQASGKQGVTISRLDNYYWNKKYSAARRMKR